MPTVSHWMLMWRPLCRALHLPSYALRRSRHIAAQHGLFGGLQAGDQHRVRVICVVWHQAQQPEPPLLPASRAAGQRNRRHHGGGG
jgi:hypothetical protein